MSTPVKKYDYYFLFYAIFINVAKYNLGLFKIIASGPARSFARSDIKIKLP
jgi:hypothetical protein